MKTFGYVMLSIIVVVLVIVSVTAGTWTYRYYTADIRGTVSQEERVASRDFRIYNYEYFYDLYASYKSYQDLLESQRRQLEHAEDRQERSRIRSNISGIEGQIARTREEYNANARKVETRARYLGDDLPKRLN